MVTWKIAKMADMSYQEIYAMLQLRNKVFIVEQRCIYQDVDGLDLNAEHCLGFKDGKLVAYARILYPQGPDDATHFGRVCVDPDYRSLGLGKVLIKQIVNHIRQNPDYQGRIEISAQHYLLKFYRELGFVDQGDVYQEDGIDHIRMVEKR